MGSAQFWQLNPQASKSQLNEETGVTTTMYSFIRSEANPGIANIRAGNQVTAKLAFTHDGVNLLVAEDLELFWT